MQLECHSCRKAHNISITTMLQPDIALRRRLPPPLALPKWQKHIATDSTRNRTRPGLSFQNETIARGWGRIEGPLTRDERRLYFILQHLRRRAGWRVDCPNGSEYAVEPSVDALSSPGAVKNLASGHREDHLRVLRKHGVEGIDDLVGLFFRRRNGDDIGG